MSVPATNERPYGGALNAAISNAMVTLMREYTGRGPTKSRTSIRGNLVVVLLEDTLTKGERVLVSDGREDTVLAMRREFQSAMKADAVASVEALTGRSVLAMMSANHTDPDLAAELFYLDSPVEGAEEADAEI